MTGELHMRFANVTNPDELELKAVVVVAAGYLVLAAVFLSGLL
jgi:hypothetical protein